MHTLLTDNPRDAARFIKRGELVAFPTETVYGLGADATSPEAVNRIFDAKGRPADNPLIVHIADFRDLTGVAESVPADALALMEAFFPGPLTLVLDRHSQIPDEVSAGLPTVGVRMPDHPLAIELIRAAECPIAAPSANLSGRPSPTTWRAVKEDLEGKISCILMGEQTPVGLESTVVDCTRQQPVVLRSGTVTLEQLRAVVPESRHAEAEDFETISSPGVLHKHYAPKARVVLVDSPADIKNPAGSCYIGLTGVDLESNFVSVKQPGSIEEYAYHLFEFFRACDRLGADTIFCEKVTQQGMGVALMDRLERAARR